MLAVSAIEGVSFNYEHFILYVRDLYQLPLTFRDAELESLNNEIAQLKLKLAPCKSSMGYFYINT